MIEKQQIIIGYFRQGKSKKQLSKELGISRNTVKKYISEYEQEQSGIDPAEASLVEALGVVKTPSYDSSNRIKHKLTEEVCGLIDKYLEQNQRKRDQGKFKQQLLGTDIHQALLGQGHEIGYTTVCRYIRASKQRSAEVFIRQHYHPGQAVEFDWAEVKLQIKGMEKRLMLAVFTSSYSNHRWARLYYRQDMSSFLDAHSVYFSYTGAIFQQLVYDNMRVAVRKFTIRNADKQPTEGLLQLSTYYQFDFRFCNARRGNEKGHVERSVEYIRRKSFAGRDSFESLEQANAYLLECCERLNKLCLKGKTQPINHFFAHELEHMKAAPAPYDASELRQLRVDKYSCVKVDTNYYSVPEGLVGGFVEVKVYPHELLIYNEDHQLIATHERRHTRFEYFLQLDHYLETLRTKPGALIGSLTLQQADKGLRQIFSAHFEQRPKDFVELLLWARREDYCLKQILGAIEQSLQCCPTHPVCLDKLKLLLGRRQYPLQQPRLEPTTSHLSEHIARQCKEQLKDIQQLILSTH